MKTRFRLLIADDDPLILDIMLNIAQQVPELTIDVAEGGGAAIELIDQSPPYDMVLTDLIMPEKSGIDVLNAVLDKSSQSLVALVTGFGNLEEAISAIRLGAYGYIHKPFRSEELKLILKNMVEYINLQQEKQRLEQALDDIKTEATILNGKLKALIDENSILKRNLLQTGISKAEHGSPREEPSSPSPDEVIKDLTKLEHLFEDQKITQDEFLKHRRRIVNRAYGAPIKD